MANWDHDLVLKAAKYAAYGLDRYWVLDPGKRELYVFVRRQATYELEQIVGEEPAEVDFRAGIARIDLAAIIDDE